VAVMSDTCRYTKRERVEVFRVLFLVQSTILSSLPIYSYPPNHSTHLNELFLRVVQLLPPLRVKAIQLMKRSLHALNLFALLLDDFLRECQTPCQVVPHGGVVARQ
jgi:hypothetical protein